MSEQLAISLQDIGKMYKVFSSRFDNFIDAMGFARMMPWRRLNYREFWALRGINLEIPRSHRLGIIGCNGAGKSTLLKLITGNLAPTEGSLTVHGRVHALMSTGAGFHPDFTGRQNIEASLIYQGLSTREIKVAIEEIAEFTELEAFLDQPFKTYSAGMQARLTFATATTLTPDILIIDEILGAGDGYFIAKSTERISRLVQETGATVLLVSHAMDQMVRFCEETIWIDRGRVVQRGPTLEVVKAYEQFLRVRTERRLRAKNRLKSGPGAQAAQHGHYSASLLFRIVVKGERSASCDIAKIKLFENGEVHETLAIGDAQDANPANSASVLFEQAHGWSNPMQDQFHHYRTVSINGLDTATANGAVLFNLWGFYDDVSYSAEVTYRSRGTKACVEVWKDGDQIGQELLPDSGADWASQTVSITPPQTPEAPSRAAEGMANSTATTDQKRAARRWPSKGTLRIERVTVCGPNRQEQAVFTPGQSMTITLQVRSREPGEFAVRPVVNIHRLDGVLVTKHHPPELMRLNIGPDLAVVLCLDLQELNLGGGSYVFSVGLFGENITEQDRYDLIDRAFEFEIVASERKHVGAIFHHPSQWRIG